MTTQNLNQKATMTIFSTYSAKGMEPEYDELEMTFFKALINCKDAANGYRNAGYKVTIIKTYGKGLTECPTLFTATKRTHLGKEFHRYEIEL